jgi:hypothetical protein
MNSPGQNFYSRWNNCSSDNFFPSRRNDSPSNNHTMNENQLLHLERDIFSIKKDINDINDELTLIRYDTGKISEYLKDIQKLHSYERELQLLQIKNVVLGILPNLVTQIVPELVRTSISNQQQIEYQEEEVVSASHIQDISEKTSISVCSEPFLCIICHTDVENNEVIRKINHCSHSFHISCLETWLGQHNNCPLCRYEV